MPETSFERKEKHIRSGPICSLWHLENLLASLGGGRPPTNEHPRADMMMMLITIEVYWFLKTTQNKTSAIKQMRNKTHTTLSNQYTKPVRSLHINRQWKHGFTSRCNFYVFVLVYNNVSIHHLDALSINYSETASTAVYQTHQSILTLFQRILPVRVRF